MASEKPNEKEKALNRVADALFALAKAQNETAKAAKRSADCAEEMLDMQRTNFAVTKALESQLMLHAASGSGKAS